MLRAIKSQKYKKSKLKNFGYLFKLFIRAFLIAVFILLSVLIMFTFIYFGDSLYNMKSGKEDNPLFSVYVIVTESMVPTIKVNDAIVVRRIDDTNIDVGDIITFSSNDRYYQGLTVTHRVVERKLDSSGNYVYTTKGDNNISEDMSLVNLNDIYGKVIFKIPKFGYVQKFVSSPTGFIISIIVPVVLVIIYEVYRVLKLIKKQNDEIEIL